MENKEFIKEFAEEALIHVEKIESSLLRLEKNEIDVDTIDEMFRSAHSVKGAAGFFGLNNVVKLAHTMETFLGDLKDGTFSLNPGTADVLLNANDCLKEMVQNPGNSESIDISVYISSISGLAKYGHWETKSASGPGSHLNMDAINAPIGRQLLFNEEIRTDCIDEDVIEEALIHGHKLYRVSIGINEIPNIKELNIITLFKKVQSIGNIIDSQSGFNNIAASKVSPGQDIIFTISFTSVLEKGLAAIALNIGESYIVELNSSMKVTEQLPEEYNTLQNINTDSFSYDTDEAVRLKDGEAKKESISIEDSIRVHTSVLDDLLNLAGEMVLARNQLLQAVGPRSGDNQGMDSALQNVKHIIMELQEKIMEIRMQPVANVFNRFPRIVRELSRKLGKNIELQMEGMYVNLDKSIIESLIDPLTHLIRNAIDHGIEKPETRERSGKPVTGTIIMKACHEGGYVKIEISDDGTGIDIDNLRKKAVEKGLIKQTDFLEMDDRDVLELLCAPGFSTTEKITDISGRGIGMNVVKTNIEKLGGFVEVDTVYGKGTTFHLTLPLTIAIISSLIVEVHGQKYAVPQVDLQEIVRIKPGDRTKKIEYINNTGVLRLRDELLPVVYLSDILSLKRENHNRDGDIVRVIVIKSGMKRIGLIVDAIHDSEEILIKPLPVYLEDCVYYSGVTILGDGSIALIIDPEGIISKAGLKPIENIDEKAETKRVELPQEEEEQQDLILFKCAGPETFGIPFSMIYRVEEIDTCCIEIIGGKEYINFRGTPLRVIHPERFLPVSCVQRDREKSYVIIPKNTEYPAGIIVERIYDNIKTQVKLDKETIKHRGLYGSCIINSRIVLLINLNEIFQEAAPEYYTRVEYNASELKLQQGSGAQ